MKEVEAACRVYLWTGSSGTSKKASVAWATVFLPRSAGGWNMKDLTVWNQAAITKLLWALEHKKEKLWVRWLDAYYMKGRHWRLFFLPLFPG